MFESESYRTAMRRIRQLPAISGIDIRRVGRSGLYRFKDRAFLEQGSSLRRAPRFGGTSARRSGIKKTENSITWYGYKIKAHEKKKQKSWSPLRNI